MVDDSKEKRFFQIQQNKCKYELTETVAICTNHAQVQTIQNPKDGQVDIKTQPKEEAACYVYLLGREYKFSPTECHRVYQSHSRVSFMPRNSWPIQNKLVSLCVVLFCLLACFIFSLFNFSLLIFGFSLALLFYF